MSIWEYLAVIAVSGLTLTLLVFITAFSITEIIKARTDAKIKTMQATRGTTQEGL